LPGAENATLDLRKVTEYLFNRTNPDGWAKGRFFQRFGFDEARPEELAWALLQHAWGNPVTHSESTAFGAKWEVTGPVSSPDGRNRIIRSVWHRNRDESEPHFVSVSLRMGRGTDESSTV
jgi:hypothetical protein